MKIPAELNMQTKEFVQVFTKFCLYLTKFGAKAMEDYLDCIPLKMAKHDGKHLGAYIVNKLLQEYQEDGTLITKVELFSSNERRSEIAEARILLCVLVHKFVSLDNSEISAMFNKSRHFAKRALSEFEKLDESIPAHRKMLVKYRKLDALIQAYFDFKPKAE